VPQSSGPASKLENSNDLRADPRVRILNALIVSVLGWVILYGAVLLPRFSRPPTAAGALLALLAATSVSAMLFLRRGALRKSAAVFLFGTCLTATVLVYWAGGIYSPALVLYAPIPMAAAWLLGHRGATLFSGACLIAVLGLALAELTGHPSPRYFAGNPIVIWAAFGLAIGIAALPVVVLLRTLDESLAAAREGIAELRATEEALRRERDVVHRIMETSPVGIIALDAEGRISFVNSSGERILGVTREEAARRIHSDAIWQTTNHDGAPYPAEEQPFRQVQKHRGVLNDVRLAISRPDGRRVLLSVNAAPVLTPDGKFDGMVASLDDMTERARIDKELQKYREGLEELVRQRTAELVVARDQALAANHAKTVFLANMSHEFRTPLNAILGLATLMNSQLEPSSDHHRQLRLIQRSGEHLLDLLNDVLDMAKIEAGAITVNNVLSDLSDLASGVVELMRPRAEEKGLRVFVQRTPACPQYVHTDARKIRQILINLISNSIKHTQQGHVSIRFDAEDGETLLLKIEVSDTGSGIAPEDQARLFDPFVAVGDRVADSAALGLAITRQYVERMGGTIRVESAPDCGARFHIRLPVAAADPAASLPGIAGRAIAPSLAPGQPAFRVLIVEDQRENRIILHQLLAAAGFEVQTVEDGAAAIRAFRSWRPHFIWMDWRLPVIDGRQATRTIRDSPGGPEVKIAALTTSVFPNERAAILSAGADDVVRKPFHPGDIFECMARLLELRYAPADAGEPSLPGDDLDAEAVRSLPEALRVELAEALISLDVPRITDAISRASGCDPRVGRALARSADSLEFTAILTALRPPAEIRRETA
jgi:PAS domain S-box-containing protein